MLLWKTIDVADDERVFVYRHKRFDRVLLPGRHRVLATGRGISLERFDTSKVAFEHRNARLLTRIYAARLASQLEAVELSDTQVGLVYFDGHLVSVLAPGSFYAYWKGIVKVAVKLIDIADSFQLDTDLLGILGHGLKNTAGPEITRALCYHEVPDEQVGLLFVNGKLQRLLQPGYHGFWKYNRSVQIKLLDLRLQAMEVNGQEILTRDRVSLRINLSATYRISDPETVALKLNDYAGFLYQELQLRLREAVGTRTLDQLLEDKDSLNAALSDSVVDKVRQYGIVLQSVGVKDIILPGDMKAILNHVVEAQKEAEANLIKRREETQAMRSLHNTARMMENNPTLLRLKELESLERVTSRIDRISVYGGLDSVLNDLVRLAPASRN